MPLPVIDCHCHAGPGEGFTGPWDTDAPVSEHLRRARDAGITHTIVFAAFHFDYARANEAVAGIVASDPARLSGLAFVHAMRDRGRIDAMVHRAATVHGFRGIKCHRYDGRITREICDSAQRHGLPVLYDVMGEVESVSLFAPQYPTVPFIIPHLGSFADEWRAQRNFIDILASHRNVFTDTSAVRRFDLLAEAVDRAGPHKVLFGSDGPWLHAGVELAKVRALRISPAARRLIEYENAARLFRLPAGTAPHPHQPPPRERIRRVRAGPWNQPRSTLQSVTAR
ncbi:MAG: amidohydrolase family protein [Phycisphaerales bacterium]|nr:amidohydrolase family protein [Phycisphaerales bacterium]